MILFPAAPQPLVERDELLADRNLSGGILLLEVVLRALRIDDVEKIGQAPIVAL